MCKTTELLGQLTEEERGSLREMGGTLCCSRIPDGHAEKLIRLGFAELICGDQQLTRQGKRALHLLGS